MPVVTHTMVTGERSWQTNFYISIFGNEMRGLSVDRSTDGYTRGILFEHKQNIDSYGRSKALSQALIYLTRFNRDGIPVPAKICLISQDDQKCLVYNTSDYMEYVEDIPSYANLKASDGISGFSASDPERIIDFNLSIAANMTELITFIKAQNDIVKVHINVHNVYGWSEYFYENATRYGQNPDKDTFFDELCNPQETLKDCIESWDGDEIDFKYIMDLLNDPKTQRELGAFYTPPVYCKMSCMMVKQAIDRAISMGAKDYIILDRCAGTGNLEQFLDDIDEDLMSHVIVSTYELKEWIVLRDRLGGRVRYLIPPIPEDKEAFPDRNRDNFLNGANALTKDILNNENVMKWVDDSNCAVILFENPPYVETTGVEYQRRNEGARASGKWKKTFVVKEMKKDISGNNDIHGSTTNDMGNAFIWGGFNYFLKKPMDSFILFSPVKYWKAQHLVNKEYMGGYAFNRIYFHAKTKACIMCAWWANKDATTDEITLQAYDIKNGEPLYQGDLVARKVYTLFSDRYYEGNRDTDIRKGILCDLDGRDVNKKGKHVTERAPRLNNETDGDKILGYLAADSNGFDTPRLHACLTIRAKYNGNGFFLRENNFTEKLPVFAASRYTDICNDWKIMSFIMKSADKADEYEKAVREGNLADFLCRTLLWVCTSHYPHMRSQIGSDKKLYLNQLCFDGDTVAKRKLDEFIDAGYTLSDDDCMLLSKFDGILNEMKTHCTAEYNSEFKYGLYQICEEVDVKIDNGIGPNGKPVKIQKYGDLHNKIMDFIRFSKEYYKKYLVDTLYEYELLK